MMFENQEVILQSISSDLQVTQTKLEDNLRELEANRCGFDENDNLGSYPIANLRSRPFHHQIILYTITMKVTAAVKAGSKS